MNASAGYRAVIFDLGGVVFPSPIDGFREYERAHGLPHRFLSEVVLADPEQGAWGRLERGELSMGEFCAAFEAECAAAGGTVDAAELMGAISSGFAPRPVMVEALRALRRHGLSTAALTNNWADDERESAPKGDVLDGLFDVVVESAVEGLRKPDVRIYELVCDRLAVSPEEAVFLDDLGVNLKPARAMGMATIKVGDAGAAVAELEALLGLSLRS